MSRAGVCALLLLSSLLTGCPGDGGGIEKVDRSGLITIYTADKPQKLDPHATSNGADVKIMNQIYERLIRVDPGNVDELVPDLAESWTVSPDGKVLTFQLRKGVTFHDGAALDAAAVKLNLDRARKVGFEVSPAPYATDLASIAGIKAEGLQLTIELSQPVARVILRNLACFYSSVVSPKVLETVKPMDAAKGSSYVTAHAVGTGPFKVDQFDPKANVVRLVANASYRGGAPAIKTLVFSPVPDENTRWQTFEKETGHRMLDDVPRQHWGTVETNDKLKLHSFWAHHIAYLGMNATHEKTKSPELRRAIQLAIDRGALLPHYKDKSAARPNYSLIPAAMGEYDPDLRVPGWDKDLETRRKRAKELIASAKLPSDLELTIYYPTLSRPYLQDPSAIADTLKQQLKAVGLNVKTQPEENAKLFSSVPSNQYELILIGWMTDNGDPDNFYSPLADGSDGKPSENNTSRILDPAIHAKITAAQKLTDAEARKTAYREIERLLQETVRGYVPLVNTKLGMAFTSTIEGIEIDVLAAYRFHKAKLK